MITRDPFSDLVEIYALDAVDGAERLDFEAHLEICGACRARLDTARSVAAELVGDSAPPDHVWDRIVEELNEEDDASVVRITEPKGRGRGPWMVLGAIAAAFAAFFAGLAINSDPIIENVVNDQTIMAAAEAAAREPSALVSEFVVDDILVGRVVLTTSGNGFLIPSQELAKLDASSTYQLWVITPDEKVISAGVLGNAPATSTFTWNGDVAGFALTREVAGGVAVSEGDVVAVGTEI